MHGNQSKTFEEIEKQLLDDLKSIKQDILNMEEHIRTGKEMLLIESEKNPEGENIFKYKNDLAELETGLDIFKNLETQMKQALENLYETKKKADEYINKNM